MGHSLPVSYPSLPAPIAVASMEMADGPPTGTANGWTLLIITITLFHLAAVLIVLLLLYSRIGDQHVMSPRTGSFFCRAKVGKR